MHIIMLETRRGTEDGYTIQEYEAGKRYHVADSLAKAFLAAGFAIEGRIWAKQKKYRKRVKNTRKPSLRPTIKIVKNI